MLEMRPNCQCCDKDLPPFSTEAFICTFECTFCQTCSQRKFLGICPNCQGELIRRPVRPNHLLNKYPASTKRILTDYTASSLKK